MKKKIKNKKISIKYKKMIIGSILLVFITATIVVLFYGKSRSLNTIMNNSVDQTRCYVNAGWKIIYKNGAAYCQKGTDCPSGYKREGSNCRSIKAIGYKYSCNPGYKREGTNPSNYYCRSIKAIGYNYDCPWSGYKREGTNPSNYYCRTIKAIGYKYVCPSGYSLVGGGEPSNRYCQSKKATHYEYHCPSAYEKKGTGENTICEHRKIKTYYCDKGWIVQPSYDGAECVRGSKGNYQYTKAKLRPYTINAKKKNGYKTLRPTKKNNYGISQVRKSNAYAKGPVKKENAYDIKPLQPNYTEYLIIPSYGNDIAGFLTPGNDTPNGVYEVSSEPKPWYAINYYSSLLNKNNYVYPKSKNGYPLGAWPKNYYNIPRYISYRAYKGLYVWPTTPYNGVYNFVYEHNGIDIAGNFAAPIYSPVDGTLVFSGWGNTENRGSDETAFSVTIKPDTSYTYSGVNINEIFMTHMSGVVRRCSNCNIKVKKGELIGFMGTAANSADKDGYFAHLHMTFYNRANYYGGLKTSQMHQLYQISSGTRRSAGG